jgi:hypothetical protein
MQVSWVETSYFYLIFFLWRYGLTRAMNSFFMRFIDHTQQRTTLGRASLDAWLSRRTDFYLTTHKIYNRHSSMSLAGFETRILTSDRPQTHAVYSSRAASGIDTLLRRLCNQFYNMNVLLIRDRVWSVVIWWKVIKVHFFLYHALKMCGEVEV